MLGLGDGAGDGEEGGVRGGGGGGTYYEVRSISLMMTHNP